IPQPGKGLKDSTMPDLPPFVDPLPIPPVLKPVAVRPDRSRLYRVVMRTAPAQFHSSLPESEIWGYEGLYPGPTIETHADRKVTLEFVNALTGGSPFAVPPDPAAPAAPDGMDNHGGSMNHLPFKPWTVPHLHGSPSPPNSDGWSDDAFFPDQSVTYAYPHQP